MKHRYRLLGGGLVVVALAVTLALLAPGRQDSLAQGEIIYVDPDAVGRPNGSSWINAYFDLQDALDAASSGDEIWVAAGTYKPTIEYGGTGDRYKSFQLMNSVALYGGFDPSVGDTEWEDRDWDANPTILSGDLNSDDGPDFTNNDENSYHVFYHPEGTDLDSTAILDGFTISGGNANGVSSHDSGGGIYNHSSSPSLANCTFKDNSADDDGGGMINRYSSPTLTNCTFQANSSGEEGSGIYNSSSSPALTNCTFEGNSAGERGGGMYNQDSSPTLTNCTFAGNSAVRNGGGLANVGSSPTLTNCSFEGNSTDASGGGVSNSSSSPALTNCTFDGNSATEAGGGMSNSFSAPTLTHCTFEGNSADDGGGINNYSSSPTLVNCTFTGNSADVAGGGMCNWYNSAPVLTNSTFSSNSAGEDGGGIANYDSSAPTLTNSILWANTKPEIYDDNSTPIVTYSDVQGGYPGTGNIDADPLFVDAASGDLRLQLTSPAIDAGDNDTAELAGVTTDLGGHRRFVDVLSVVDTGNGAPPIVDMGAYEAPPDLVFVDLEATGDNDGSSWEHAFTNLRDALARAVNGVEIWVAAGTYKPTHGFWPVDPRSVAFRLMNGVTLYGGFDVDAGDTAWEDRDWASNVTILSGDIGTEGDNSDNAYHVFYHPDGTDLDSTAILDGFTITGGNANGASPHDSGGGIYNYSSSPSLANLTFTDNAASGYGGGIYNWFSFPALTNDTFQGNSTGNSGGGIYNARSSPSLIDCTFAGNSAEYGGGIYNSQSSPALVNCTFWGNSAVNGGGIWNAAVSSPTLTNCTFWGNSAFLGSGIYNRFSSPVLANCVLWGDSLSAIHNHESDPLITYSDIKGGYEGEGNINANPLFVDPDSGDFHVWACSPCIDAGVNKAPDLPEYDFEGDDRIVDGDGNGTATVDMGVDEVAVAGTCFRLYLPLVVRGY